MIGGNALEFVIKVKDLSRASLTAAQARIRSFASSAGASFKSIGKNLVNIKAGFDMAAGAVRAFAGVFATAIGEAFKFEKALTDFKVLTGSIDTAKAHIEELRAFANKTPLTFNDLSSASKMLLSFGVSVNEVMPALKMLGDISMGDAQKFSGLALVFGQVKSAGKLMGQDLLQMINQGFNPLTVIAKETGKSMSELKEMMSDGAISFEMVQAAMESATSAGGLFANAMGEASTTGTGLISSLQDNWTEAVRTFGVAFSDSAKGGIQFLLDKLTELINSGDIQVWADRTAKALLKVVDGAMDVAKAIGAVSKFVWKDMGISDVVHGVEGVVKGVSAAAGTLAGGGSWSEAMEANDHAATKAFAKGHYLGGMVRDGSISSKGGDRAMEGIRREEAETAKREAEIRETAKADGGKAGATGATAKRKTISELMAESEAKAADARAKKEAEAAAKLAARKAALAAKEREREEKERKRLEEKLHKERLRLEAEEVREQTKNELDMINGRIAARQGDADAWEADAQRARGVDFGDWDRGERDRAKDQRTAANKQKNREKSVDQEIERLEGMSEKARGKWGNDRLEKLRKWKDAQNPANNQAANEVEQMQREAAAVAKKSEQHLAQIAKQMQNLGL